MTTPADPDWKARAESAEAEVARLRLLVDHEVSYKDLETKFRDGTFDLRAVLGEGSRPATKFLAAIMWHAIVGEEGDPAEPPNYQATVIEWALTPAETFREIRCAMEVIKPGGKSSHEIRKDLEAEIAELRHASCGCI